MSKTKWYARAIYLVVALAMVVGFGLMPAHTSPVQAQGGPGAPGDVVVVVLNQDGTAPIVGAEVNLFWDGCWLWMTPKLTDGSGMVVFPAAEITAWLATSCPTATKFQIKASYEDAECFGIVYKWGSCVTNEMPCIVYSPAYFYTFMFNLKMFKKQLPALSYDNPTKELTVTYELCELLDAAWLQGKTPKMGFFRTAHPGDSGIFQAYPDGAGGWNKYYILDLNHDGYRNCSDYGNATAVAGGNTISGVLDIDDLLDPYCDLLCGDEVIAVPWFWQENLCELCEPTVTPCVDCADFYGFSSRLTFPYLLIVENAGAALLQPTKAKPIVAKPGQNIEVKWLLHADCQPSQDFYIEVYNGGTKISPDITATISGTEICHCYQGISLIPISSTAPEGIYNVRIRSLCSACPAEDLEEGVVCIDKTPPTLTKQLDGTPGDDGWYTSDVTVTLTAQDVGCAGVNKIEYNLDGAGWTTYSAPFTISTNGSHTLQHRVSDKAGNQYVLPQQAIKIDKTAPTLTKQLAGTQGNDGWYISDVTVTLTGADAVSGLAKVEYNLDDEGWTTYSAPFVISTDGVHTLQHRAFDNAGNEFELQQQEIKIDQTDPTLEKTFDGWKYEEGVYWNEVTVTLTGDDETSGLEKVQYKVWKDGDTEPTSWTDYTVPFDITGVGTWHLRHQAIDNAGNEFELGEQEVTIIVDELDPTLEKKLNGEDPTGGWYTDDVEVTLTGSDPPDGGVASGVANIEYKVGDADWVTVENTENYEPFIVNFTISEEGTIILQHKVTDNAGNEFVLDQQEVKIDKTPPVLVKDIPGTQYCECECYITPVTVTLTATDDGSGVNRIEYKVWQDEEPEDWIVVQGGMVEFAITDECTTHLRHRAFDNVGREFELEPQDVSLSLTGPTAPVLVSPANGATVTSALVTFAWEPVEHKMPITYNIVIKQKDTYRIIWEECGIEVPTITLKLFNDNYRWYVTAKDCTGELRESKPSDWFYLRVVTDEKTPSVVVNSPNGGESLMAGSTQTITWTATDDMPGTVLIDLAYSSDGGSNWSEVATGEANDGAYPWDVPDISSNRCLVKAVATDSGDNSASDTSNNVFAITQAAVAQEDVPLDEDWNLISLPLIPNDTAIDTVLTDIMDDVISVWYYNAATGTWLSYAPALPPEVEQDLTSMEDGKGYWMDMLNAATLEIDGSEMPMPVGGGTPPSLPAYDVVAGWNAIGFKSTTAMPAKDYLDAMAGKYTRIYGFKEGAYFAIPSPYTRDLEPSLGYWVSFTQAGTVYP